MRWRRLLENSGAAAPLFMHRLTGVDQRGLALIGAFCFLDIFSQKEAGGMCLFWVGSSGCPQLIEVIPK